MILSKKHIEGPPMAFILLAPFCMIMTTGMLPIQHLYFGNELPIDNNFVIMWWVGVLSCYLCFVILNHLGTEKLVNDMHYHTLSFAMSTTMSWMDLYL